jgi:drug/metabolite transporter (DMT)-like permease
MGYFYLISAVLSMGASSLFGTAYNRRTADRKNAVSLYNLIHAATVLVFWAILWLSDFSFDASVLWYSIGFGVSYAAANIGFILALANGPTALTGLVMQLSLIATTIWGLFFWDSQLTPFIFIGLVLAVVSLVLCLYQKSNQGERITAKWMLFALISFLGNTGCTVIQRTQQMVYAGKHGNMMMFFAIICALIVCALLYVKQPAEAPVAIAKKSGLFPILGGVFNAMQNLLVILLATTALDPSLIYPVLAIGFLAVSSIGAKLLFGERLSLRQWVGIALGGAAVALLSI